MNRQRGYGAFPTTFLTFSLFLLVLAAGFAVGRLVVGRVYLRSASQFERLPIPRGEGAGQEGSGAARVEGRGYVPAPVGEPSEGVEELEPEAFVSEEPEGSAPESPDVEWPADASLPVSEPVESVPPPEPEEREKRYAIQVGLFQAKEGAQQLADDLARSGYPSRVEVGREGDTAVYRVLTGRYRTEYAARKALEELKQEGFTGFLVER